MYLKPVLGSFFINKSHNCPIIKALCFLVQSSLVLKTKSFISSDVFVLFAVKHTGNITFDDIVNIARTMRPRSMARSLAGVVKEILGKINRLEVINSFAQDYGNSSALELPQSCAKPWLSATKPSVQQTEHCLLVYRSVGKIFREPVIFSFGSTNLIPLQDNFHMRLTW